MTNGPPSLGRGAEGGFRAITGECQQREKAVGCLVPAINTNQKALHLIRTAVVADGLQSPTSHFGADIEPPPTSRGRRGDKEIEVRGGSLGHRAGRRNLASPREPDSQIRTGLSSMDRILTRPHTGCSSAVRSLPE